MQNIPRTQNRPTNSRMHSGHAEMAAGVSWRTRPTSRTSGIAHTEPERAALAAMFARAPTTLETFFKAPAGSLESILSTGEDGGTERKESGGRARGWWRVNTERFLLSLSLALGPLSHRAFQSQKRVSYAAKKYNRTVHDLSKQRVSLEPGSLREAGYYTASRKQVREG